MTRYFRVSVRAPALTGDQVAASIGRSDIAHMYSAQPAQDVTLWLKASTAGAASEYALAKHPGAQVLKTEPVTDAYSSSTFEVVPGTPVREEEARIAAVVELQRRPLGR